jgi:O-antigen ligase
MHAHHAGSSLRIDAGSAAAMGGIAALAVLGYVASTDLRVTAAGVGLAALAGWFVYCVRHPATALSLSIGLLLIAGTKFRERDALASVDGVADGQIVLELVLFGAIGVAVAGAWIGSRERSPLTSIELAIGGYCAMALISTIWSAAPALTLVRAGQVIFVAALAMAFARVVSVPRALWLVCAWIAAYALVCGTLASVFPWASGTALDVEQRLRFAWFSVNPIAAGTFAAIGALGLLSTLFWRSSAVRTRLAGVPLACAALPLVAILIATNSRGPLLGLLGACAVLVLMRMSSSIRTPILATAAAAALLVFAVGADVYAWLFSASMADSSVAQLFFQGQSPDAVLDFSGRMQLWGDVGPALADQPILGYGYQASRPVLLSVAEWAGYAHNALLQSLLDLGIVGTLPLVGLVAVAFRAGRARHLESWARGTIAALMVFLVLNSVSDETFAGAPGIQALLLFLCALAAARPHTGAGFSRPAGAL